MASINRPDKITLDAYSDAGLQTQLANGVYNRFTNQLQTPILNAKGVQLLSANFVNTTLQLNDNGQLMFFYYASSTQANIRQLALLQCIRLYPSNFVPYTGFTNFTRNKYFNSVPELVAALNAASIAGGDDVLYNPLFSPDTISFAYDATTRKISISSVLANQGGLYLAPAAADDPFVLDVLRGTTSSGSRIRMNSYNSGNTYATAPLQPYVEGVSMNARLGFAMSFNARPLWVSSASQVGCATSTGVPTGLTLPIEADANPILLGTQNVNIYCSIVMGSGVDSRKRKNLLASVPIEVASLNINSYTLSSVEKPAISVPNEIYEISIEMLDDYGLPFTQPPSYNTQMAISLYY